MLELNFDNSDKKKYQEATTSGNYILPQSI